MTISLQKGGDVNLSVIAPTTKSVRFCMGWDAHATDPDVFIDIDAICFMLNTSGKLPGQDSFIFFNNLKSADGAVEHLADIFSGDCDNDDLECIKVDLSKIAPDLHKVVVALTIHDGDARKLNFGMVSNAYIRVVDAAGNDAEIARFDLPGNTTTETAMILGELYRDGSDWKFKAIGQGFNGGLKALAESFGLNW